MLYLVMEVYDQIGKELVVSASRNQNKFRVSLEKVKIVKEDALQATATFALTEKTAAELGLTELCLTNPGF